MGNGRIRIRRMSTPETSCRSTHRSGTAAKSQLQSLSFAPKGPKSEAVLGSAQSPLLPQLHKAINHPLAPRCFEIDFQLVAILRHHRAVAELVVEHARAEGDVAAGFGGEAGGGAGGFGQRRGVAS